MKINRKYKHLWDKDYDYAIITGGRGSSKSFTVGDFLENLSFERGHTILFTRYTMISAHLSVIPEFQEKIELEGHKNYFQIAQTEITNKLSGSRIIFRGIKTAAGVQTAALKSIMGLTTWIVEEAEELTDEGVFDKIDESVRHPTVKNRVILILNPASKEHWIYKRFFEDRGVDGGFNGIKDRVLYIHTDFRDNIDNLSEKFLQKIDYVKKRYPEKYKHRILGSWLDRPDGVIFENWEYGDFDETIPFGYGLDWGFSVDPDALIKVAIDKKNKIIYAKEIIYKNGLVLSDLLKRMKANNVGKEDIIADSSDPRMIAELRKAHYNCKPVKKKAGSVIEGIKLMQDYKIVIDRDSTNIGREMNNYQWHDKKSETPQDAWNHALDSVRYYVTYRTASFGEYAVR